MLIEERYNALKKLHNIMEEEEKLLRRLDLLNVFQNNKFRGQKIAVQEALGEAELDYQYSTSSNSNCGTLLTILSCLGLQKQKAYGLGHGEYIEIKDNRVLYVSYPFAPYGGEGSTPKKIEEITVENAVSLIKHYIVDRQ